MEDNEEKTVGANGKLFRRDTPHYTKRARIKDGTENEQVRGGDMLVAPFSSSRSGTSSSLLSWLQVVLKILEKYRTPSGGSNTSGGSAGAMLAAAGGVEGPLPMGTGSHGDALVRPTAAAPAFAQVSCLFCGKEERGELSRSFW